MKFGNTLSGAIAGGVSGFASGGLAGGLLGAGLGALSGFGDDASNAEAQKAAKSANDMNLAYWNMQNTYNSPVEQMARLKEAGLNPMLVYGSGNVTGNSSSSITSAQTYANKYNTLAGIQGVQALSNLKNTNANTAGTEANTLATYQDIKNMQSANAIQQEHLEQEKQATAMGAMDLEVAKRIQKGRLKAAHYGVYNDLLNQYLTFKDLGLNKTVLDNGGREIAYGWNVGKRVIGDTLGIAHGLADTQASFSRAERDHNWVGLHNSLRNYRKR